MKVLALAGALFGVIALSCLSASPETMEVQKDKVAQPILYAHYYGWYGPDQWGQPRTNDPSLGLYNSDDNASVEKHIEWGKRAGIKVFSVSWHGQGSVTDKQLKDHLVPEITGQQDAESGLEFMILFETPDVLDVRHGNLIDFDDEHSDGVSRGDWFLQEMEYLADTYFNTENYHRVDGRPVVFIYLLRGACLRSQTPPQTALCGFPLSRE